MSAMMRNVLLSYASSLERFAFADAALLIQGALV